MADKVNKLLDLTKVVTCDLSDKNTCEELVHTRDVSKYEYNIQIEQIMQPKWIWMQIWTICRVFLLKNFLPTSGTGILQDKTKKVTRALWFYLYVVLYRTGRQSLWPGLPSFCKIPPQLQVYKSKTAQKSEIEISGGT